MSDIGPLIGPSAYFMKTPPKQFKDDIAREMTEGFFRGAEQAWYNFHPQLGFF
jgi:hypothetical protein